MSEVPKTKAECEAVNGTWDEETQTCTLPNEGTSSTQSITPDADLMRENEMLKAELKLRKEQLRQAIGIANKANDRQKAREAAERKELVSHIIVDSGNKWTEDELKDKSLTELKLINTALNKNLDQTFASIAAHDAEAKRRRQPMLTVGAWDSRKKTWVGGE